MIRSRQNLSPTPIVDVVNQALRGSQRMAAELALAQAENRRLRTANAELSRRKSRQKKVIGNQRILTQVEGTLIANQIAADAVRASQRDGGSGESSVRIPRQRRCGLCREPGHRRETCSLYGANSAS
jgi:hypothetical protein